MAKNIQTEKLNAAIDILIKSDVDLSDVLGKEGLNNRANVNCNELLTPYCNELLTPLRVNKNR